MGNLSTPQSVQKLQTALHAKAKAEAGYRFYALYDKISREDILAHATATMLVLEPIFEADLPPEQYAYRPGRNAQQAVVEKAITNPKPRAP